MRIPLSSLALASLCLAGVAQAHGPSRQKVIETIAIDAPADAVWQRLQHFNDMSWHPAVERVSATDGDTVGSIRTITLKGGGTIIESLEKYDAAARQYAYRMKDPGPVPVNNYTSTIHVTATGDRTSQVEWRGAFYRAFLNNDPPADQNDEAAVKAVTGIYKSGLDALKHAVEEH